MIGDCLGLCRCDTADADTVSIVCYSQLEAAELATSPGHHEHPPAVAALLKATESKVIPTKPCVILLMVPHRFPNAYNPS
jgi:hypothetical protein